MSSASPPRLTQTGLVVSVLAVVTVAAGLVMFSGPVLAVGLAALALVAICRSLAARHLEGFSVARDLPRRARAGESFPMELRLHSGPRLPSGIVVNFTDPLAPAVRERPFVLELASPHSLRCTGLAHRRGPLPPRPWLVSSTWPLGLFLTEHQGLFRDDHATLVLPKPWLPSRLRERLERLSLESAERPLEPADPLAEFRFLREFRHGDPVRGIHWPTSLRSGRLQYAETEPPRPKPYRYGVFLHSYEAPGTIITPETYELILRIATGLMMKFQRDEIVVVFEQAPRAPVLLRERHEFSALLEALALSRRHPQSSAEAIFGTKRLEKGDPYHDCDEVFVLGDGPLAGWESAARARFPHATCLDTTQLTSGSRPTLRVRASPRP
jgi:uncharacterized protein (DUF58 family)